MVSEIGGGQPPSSPSLPAAEDDAHPVGVVTVPQPVLPEVPGAPGGLTFGTQALDWAAQAAGSPPAAAAAADADSDNMQVDGEGSSAAAAALHAPLPPPSRSPSPFVVALKPSAAAAAAAAADSAVQHADQHQASSFVPIGELGGPGPAQQGPAQHAEDGPAVSDGDEPSSLQPSAGERPASPTGYESGDDMDMLAMRHCVNCTGPLWGHICMDCGHMTAHDGDIFRPTVAPATALHRPRLQGDALTVISWDERMELHEEGGASMHPERPDRVRAVMARLHAAELAGRCRRLPAREATPEEIAACHIPELLDAVDALSEQSRLQGNADLHFTPDTYVNQHTAMCAKLSAGACVDVAAAVVRGEARAGVAVVRPPGHHAESNTAMGFCFFNNAGIAARAAQAAGAGRVLVVDWDVHHGNGTQHIFDGDASVMYVSLHRYDGGSFYPGTGAAHEVGEGAGEGYSVNVPWPCGGMRNADYLAAFHHVVLPIAYEYAPDLVIISAGFDAAEGDPIGGCHLTPECYAHMAAQLQLVAPTVALLEGGYNLVSTAKGTEAVLRVLLGERPPALPAPDRPACAEAMGVIAQVMRVQSRYWDCMRGLVQQQFRVLAAAAARQEQLAAMKARRAAAGALGASAAGDLGDASPHGGLCGGDLGGGEEEAGDEEEALLGDVAPRHHHQSLHAVHDGLDEETDTPHQQYRGGSGWESDADLASGERQLSGGASDGEDGQQLFREDSTAGAAHQHHRGGEGGGLPDSAWASPEASPQRGQQGHLDASGELGRAASDTLPMSDSEAPGSGSNSDGNNGGGGAPAGGPHSDGAAPRPAGLTSASLSPAAAEGGVVTPPGEQLLAASDSPASTPAVGAAGTHVPEAKPVAQPAGSPRVGDSAQRASWPRALSVKPVVLKRPGHVAQHQRLSPALAGDDAMQLVRQQPGVPHAAASAAAVPGDPAAPLEAQHELQEQ